jgi:hypothetical protein
VSRRRRRLARLVDHGSPAAAHYREVRHLFGPDHPATIEAWVARGAELLVEEQGQPVPGMYVVTFADAGSHRGTVVVYAIGPVHAVIECHRLELNPGGGAEMRYLGPVHDVAWLAQWSNRLLDQAEAETLLGSTLPDDG